VVETDSDELLVGAGTAMTDVLGRHAYAVDAAWANRARPDWHAAYAYDRWAPTLFTSYSDDTDPFRGGAVRSRELTAGALLPVRHIRWTETWLGAFERDTDSFRCDEPCDLPSEQRRRSLRGGWMHDSRRAYGYSISSEEGVQIETAAETTRAAFGSGGNGGATIVDARGFQRVTSGHTVVAGRIAFAPKEEADYNLFWSAGNGFGQLARTAGEVSLTVLGGSLDVGEIAVDGFGVHRLASRRPISAGERLVLNFADQTSTSR